MLTKFQHDCRAEVMASLAKLDIHPQFEVRGESESYLQSDLETETARYRIFIYEDEAGFYEDEEWNIWESQDYDQPGDLIEEFVRSLRKTFQR